MFCRLLCVLLVTLPLSTTAASPPSGSWYHWQLLSPEKTPVSLPDTVARWDDINVILVGEWHSHAGIHHFQSELLNQLMWHSSTVALSMEQFSRDQQTALDSYLKSETGEHVLLTMGWPNYASDYRPLVEQMKLANRPVIAANAPREIVRCVAVHGADYLDTLPHKQQLWVAPDLNLDDPAYRAKFEAAIPHNEAPSEHQFAAQVTWDETMADSILFHLATYPQAHIMHIAGSFHIENGLGIEARLVNREPTLKTVLITPITQAELELYQPNDNEYLLLVSPIPTYYLDNESPSYSHHHSTNCLPLHSNGAH